MHDLLGIEQPSANSRCSDSHGSESARSKALDTVLSSGDRGLIAMLEVAEDDVILAQSMQTGKQIQHLASARLRLRKAIDHIQNIESNHE